MINLLNKKGIIPSKINKILIVLDIAMYNTGISFWINGKLMVLDTIKTPTSVKDNITLGNKAIEDVKHIYEWLAKSNVGIVLKDINTLGIKKEIDITDLQSQVIIENGIILNRFNASTTQKLSIWTGLYIGSLIETMKQLGLRNLRIKIIHPSQWQSIIQNQMGVVYSKELGIQMSNNWLKNNLGPNFKVENDDEGDALMIGNLADKLEDQIEKKKIIKSFINKDIQKQKRKRRILFLINDAEKEARRLSPKKLPKKRRERLAKWKEEYEAL